MTGAVEQRNPLVLWAQRKDCIYLTIAVEDCKDAKIQISESAVKFSGTGGDKISYSCVLVPWANLNASESKYAVRDRVIEMLLKKEKVDDVYWPRLLKDSSKAHWLRVDFNKWKDEDDSDNDGEGGNFEEMMRQMGGFGGAQGENFDEDSDDEELPDLEPASPTSNTPVENAKGDQEKGKDE